MLSTPSAFPTSFVAKTTMTAPSPRLNCTGMEAPILRKDAANVGVPIADGVAPRATRRVQLVANLDAQAVVPLSWDVKEPTLTSNFMISIEIFDDQGVSHVVDFYFRKSAERQFEYHAVVAADELDSMLGAGNVEVGAGVLLFGPDGVLLAVRTTVEIELRFSGARHELQVDLDLGCATDQGGTGEDGLTAHCKPFSLSFRSQDGRKGGRFATLGVSSDNTVYAVYTNGERLPLLSLL